MALSLTSYAVPVGSEADCAGRALSVVKVMEICDRSTSGTSPDLFHAARFRRLALIIMLRHDNDMLCRHELAPLVKGSGDPA